MWIKELFILFMSLALGYILCVVAKKQDSVLKTLGYTLGIATITLSLLSGLFVSQASECWKGKPCCMGDRMMKCMRMPRSHR